MHGGTRYTLPAGGIGRGLSPRARGNRGRGRQGRAAGGSIPACTGEPPPPDDPPTTTRVYPRVHGGTARGRHCPGLLEGLSPRARGNQHARRRPIHVVGSIPACTGEPTFGLVDRTDEAVYPRVHGGTAVYLERLPSPSGLSPRARGNLVRLHTLRARLRSIPACTGEPAASKPK